MQLSIFLCLLLLSMHSLAQEIKIPIDALERSSLQELELTEIGEFGLLRKERPNVPVHLHTGIDIKRIGNNYENNLIFPIAEGIVISKRDDGPFAQLILEHYMANRRFWTVYEHIAGIAVELYDEVTPDQPIARFMNKEELNKYGWQFDHFHLEILKIAPLKISNQKEQEDRHFMSFTLKCFFQKSLTQYYYDPVQFLMDHL